MKERRGRKLWREGDGGRMGVRSKLVPMDFIYELFLTAFLSVLAFLVGKIFTIDSDGHDENHAAGEDQQQQKQQEEEDKGDGGFHYSTRIEENSNGKEKLYQWIVRQQEEGSRLSAADIVAHMQNEIEYGGDEASASPRVQASPHQQPQSTMQVVANAGMQTSSGAFTQQAAVGHGPRTCQSDQAKNFVFSNALSSPVRRSLQSYQLVQGGQYQSANEARNNEADSTHHQNRGSNSPCSNDSMDMHSDSPAHESY